MSNRKIINLNPLGKDSIIGGVFFGSDMTPSGLFKNIPRYDFKPEIEEKESELMLTLNKVKNSINSSLGAKDLSIENAEEINTFLKEYVDLLIDHRDLRNYIFYGSAATEISYQLNNLINQFPYKTLISENINQNDINLKIVNFNGKNHTEIIFPTYINQNRSDERIIKDNWNRIILDDTNQNLDVSNLKIVDRNNKFYDIKEIVTPYKNDSEKYIITNIENITYTTNGVTHDAIKITTLEDLNFTNPQFVLDKVFVNGTINNLILSYNNKTIIASKQKFKVLKKISSKEFLLGRVDSFNSSESLKIVNISGSDTIGGLIIFGEKTTIYNVTKIENFALGLRNLIRINFHGGSENSQYLTPSAYNIGDVITFFNAKKENQNIDIYYETVDELDNRFQHKLNEFEQRFRIVNIIHIANHSNRSLDKYNVYLEREEKININEEIFLIGTPDYDNLQVRYSDIEKNGEKFWVKILVEGILSYEHLLTYEDKNGELNKGFLISPSKKIISNFDENLNPLQKFLLSPSPVNEKPWPRRPITGNIQNYIEDGFSKNNVEDFTETEIEFYDWLQDPELFHQYKFGELKEELFSNNLYNEFQLIRAIYNDENETNILLRQALPIEILNEVDDSEFYFGRFISIAGWFFDQIKLYIDFLKYTHTIHYGEFNQLSPEFYRQYASHYGFDLFEDEDVDFTKLVIEAEPGFYYSNNNNHDTNKYFTKTLLQAQQERQKRLLINLFHLYSLKGTKICIEKLVSLIGAPKGLMSIKEYAFKVNNLDNFGIPIDSYSGDLIVDNEKVHVPNFKFEIDTDFLKDKDNLNNPINKPFVYKKVYENDYTYNLREITLEINENDAVSEHLVEKFGEQTYNFIGLNEYEFANLQKENNYLLPLTFPDKYYGFSVEFMIPHNAYNGINNIKSDIQTYNLLNLYEVSDVMLNSFNQISNIELDDSMISAKITTITSNGFKVGDVVFVINGKGINGINSRFSINEIVSSNEFIVNGNFSLNGESIEYGMVTLQGLNKIELTESELSYSYPLPANFNNRNSIYDGNSILEFTNPDEDYNILKQKYPNSNFVGNKQYIMSRIEGRDIVFRIRLKSEKNGEYHERVAIFENIVDDDGLIHSYRFTILSDGIIIFKDFDYVGLAKYMDLNLNLSVPMSAYQIPKYMILDALYESENCEFNYYSNLEEIFAEPEIGNLGNDSLKWWDIFTGMPENLSCLINKINIFENRTINDYNFGDKLTNNDTLTSELYLFECTGDKTNIYSEDFNFDVRAIFFPKNLNNLVDFYGYQLETEVDDFNRNTIKSLSLSNKRINDIETSYILNNYFINKKQDFFKKIDIFASNAWFKEMHEAYEYKLFNGDLNKLYQIYSRQILTHNSLKGFMSFVEAKLKKVITNFIPIVINMLNFGKSVVTSDVQLSKMRYNNKFCKGIKLNRNSIYVDKIFKNNEDDLGINENATFNIKLNIPGHSIVFYNKSFNWYQNRIATLWQVANDINLHFESLGFKISKSDVYYETLRILLNFDEISEYFSNLSLEITPNDFEILINDVIKNKLTFSNSLSNDIIPGKINSCGIVEKDPTRYSEECGYVEYGIEGIQTIETFVYYKQEDENDNPVYVHKKDEANVETNIINYKNE